MKPHFGTGRGQQSSYHPVIFTSCHQQTHIPISSQIEGRMSICNSRTDHIFAMGLPRKRMKMERFHLASLTCTSALTTLRLFETKMPLNEFGRVQMPLRQRRWHPDHHQGQRQHPSCLRRLAGGSIFLECLLVTRSRRQCVMSSLSVISSRKATRNWADCGSAHLLRMLVVRSRATPTKNAPNGCLWLRSLICKIFVVGLLLVFTTALLNII